MPRNAAKRAFDDRDTALGAWVESASPRAAEVLGASGLAWVGIDMEHTPVGFGDVEAIVRAVERTDATPIVRLPSVSDAVSSGCKRVLDAGARGIIVPRVETPTQAERVVRASSFPPEGDRGVAGSVRANGYGTTFDDYVTGANADTLVVVQLETAAGVERADDILGVDGVDVGFVGENDLSASMGYPGEPDRAPVQEAVDSVARAAAENGVAAGVAARTPSRIRERVEAGFTFILIGGDLSMLRQGVTARRPDA